MNFKSEIRQASSSKTKLVFVKVPNSINDLTVDNDRNELSGDQLTKTGVIDWFSPKLPDGKYKFIGYNHELTDSDIETYFSSWAEFYQLCNPHEIIYCLSEFKGKWAVLAPTI